MISFQKHQDRRIPSSDIHLLESEGISITWGNFHLNEILNIQKYSTNESINKPVINNKYFLSHFHFSGYTETQIPDHNFQISDTQHTFFSFREDVPINLHITPSKTGNNSFFEYSFSEEYFFEHFLKESPIMNNIANQIEKNIISWAGKSLYITPAMMYLIQEIIKQPYSGSMMSLYLESKVIELYLAQIYLFDTSFNQSIKLLKNDIDRLYSARTFLADNLDKNISIATLSKLIGINQTKLKAGFKQLFGTTIFDYTIELKMNLAMNLLQEGRFSLMEISEMTGYSHPNHFSYAFKRRFGFPPSLFSSCFPHFFATPT